MPVDYPESLVQLFFNGRTYTAVDVLAQDFSAERTQPLWQTTDRDEAVRLLDEETVERSEDNLRNYLRYFHDRVPADHPALGGPFDVNAEQKQPSDAGH